MGEPLHLIQIFFLVALAQNAMVHRLMAVKVYNEAIVKIRKATEPNRGIFHFVLDSLGLRFKIARLRIQVTNHVKLIWRLISALWRLIYSRNSFACLYTFFAFV